VNTEVIALHLNHPIHLLYSEGEVKHEEHPYTPKTLHNAWNAYSVLICPVEVKLAESEFETCKCKHHFKRMIVTKTSLSYYDSCEANENRSVIKHEGDFPFDIRRTLAHLNYECRVLGCNGVWFL
jgi:hypothetical protein